jgi:hydrogenase/urease accessory protein HupE
MIFAHGSMAMGELYAGLLQPVLHFESLLPILALALWAAQQEAPLLWQLPLAFAGAALVAACAALFGFAVPGAAHVQSAAMLGFGGLVAARVRLPAVPALAFAALAGLAQGSVGAFGEPAAAARPVLYVLGFALGLGLLLFHVENLAVRARAFWMQIGIRVVGSWIAAVGVLISVLSLRS